MIKTFLTLFFLCLSFCSSSFAISEVEEEAKLQKSYGEDLTQVPFFLKYSYNKKYGVDWGQTSYPARRAFLEEYDQQSAEEQRELKAEAKLERAQEKEQQMKAKQDAQRLKEWQREQAQEVKEEALEEKEREKEYEAQMKVQNRELQDMIELEQKHGASEPAMSSPPDQSSQDSDDNSN